MKKKLISTLMILFISVFFIGGAVSEAGFSGGSRSSSSSSKSSSSISTTKSAPTGSSYKTSDGSKVTSGGGNVSGYKSSPGSTNNLAPKATANTQAGKSTTTQSTTNNNYYDNNRSSGMGGFWTGAAIGSLLTMPSHRTVVVNGNGGYAQAAPSGFDFLGWLFWLFSWVFILGLLGVASYYGWRYWKGKK